jgi:glycosyltransferase involved in cell wall biosynthesis
MSSSARSSDREPSRTRLLYVITSDISARFLRGQLADMMRRGFDVSVATALSNPPAAFDAGTHLHDVGFRRQPSPAHDVRALISTVRVIRRVRPAVVNASTPKAGLIGMTAAWLCRVPRRVYVVRGLRFETTAGTTRRVLCLLERLATAFATDVVFNSRSLLDAAERSGAVRAGRGRVLAGGSGNGIDPRPFTQLPERSAAKASFGLDPGRPVVGFVGRFTRDKGIEDLVAAFGENADVTVLLVGDHEDGDPIAGSVRATIERAPHVRHVPWTDDLRTAYRAMDVLVFPSYREGLPNVPLESQLCETPVVAYAATGTVDALADGVGGVLVPVGQTSALHDRTVQLLDDPELRSRMGSAGRAWVTERFDQSVVWGALADVIGANDISDAEAPS